MVAQTQTIKIMKDLMTCSIDELLTERQNAIEVGNIERYRECNEIISTICNLKANNGFYFGMDRNGNKGYFEDFEQSIGE
jgi:hypothetical protein